jgi:hypothetical protein
MASLSTDEIAEHFEAALATEEDCRTALERLQIESATAGAEPSPAELEAEAELSKATTARERLEAALTASQRRDAVKARETAANEVRTQELVIGKLIEDVEKGAAKMTAALIAYAAEYDRFCRTIAMAQGQINGNSRIRRDRTLPNPERACAEELSRVAFGLTMPPGASIHAVQFHDPTQLPPLVEVYRSYSRAFRDDLALPDPA